MGITIGGGNFNVGLEALNLAAQQRQWMLEQQRLAQARAESSDRMLQAAAANKAAIDAKRIEQAIALQHLQATQAQQQQFHQDEMQHRNDQLAAAAQARQDAITARHEDLRDRIAARADANAQNDARLRFLAEENNRARREREDAALAAKQDMLTQRLTQQQALADAKNKPKLSLWDPSTWTQPTNTERATDATAPSSIESLMQDYSTPDEPKTPTDDDVIQSLTQQATPAPAPTRTFDATPPADTNTTVPDDAPIPDAPPTIEPGATPDMNVSGQRGEMGVMGIDTGPVIGPRRDDDATMAALGAEVGSMPFTAAASPTTPATLPATEPDPDVFVPPSNTLPPLPDIATVPPALHGQWVAEAEKRQKIDSLAHERWMTGQKARETMQAKREALQAKQEAITDAVDAARERIDAARNSGQNPHHAIELAAARERGHLPDNWKDNPLMVEEVRLLQQERAKRNEEALKFARDNNVINPHIPDAISDKKIWADENKRDVKPELADARYRAIMALKKEYPATPSAPRTTTPMESGAKPTPLNASAQAPVEIKNAKERDALPPGTFYRYNGQIGRK